MVEDDFIHLVISVLQMLSCHENISSVVTNMSLDANRTCTVNK